MFRNRAIPCLLLKDGGLVKTVKFKKGKYLGDPINTLKIFNDKEVDEIAVLDIEATKLGKELDYGLIERLCSQCFMPLSYGGGIRNIEQVRRLLNLGIEKVVINSEFLANPELISEIAGEIGSQSTIVSIDAKNSLMGGWHVRGASGTRKVKKTPATLAREAQDRGAGEILLNSIDQDGVMQGYDLDLIKSVTGAVSIPVIACGGASGVEDLGRAVLDSGAAAAAAGSIFVFKGPHRAVLINYPTPHQLNEVFAAVP